MLSRCCMPLESPPHPDTTATYCFPSTVNDDGGARIPEFVGNSQRSLPVDASNAWNFRSLVPPVKTRPPAVASIEPQFDDWSYACIHTRCPVSTFQACTSPKLLAPGAMKKRPNCGAAEARP